MTMIKIVLVLFFVIGAFAQDSFEDTGVRLALKIYDDCSKGEGLSPCLKKKAINFLDRLGRMDKLTLTDGVVVQKTPDAPQEGPAITEEQLEQTLPRSSDAKDAALSNMLLEKITNYIGSRSIKVDLPKISAEDLIEEGRQHGHLHGGGGKKKGGKKHMKGMKDIKGAIMMGLAAKMAALIPLAIGGLFFLAKKALITAKIALIISGIIAVKKLLASKKGGGAGGSGGILGGDGGHGGYGGGGGGWQAGGGGGWQSGGGGGSGGWQSSGGGWDKRSYNEAQTLAYKAHSPKQT